jgi:hypothetical protein
LRYAEISMKHGFQFGMEQRGETFGINATDPRPDS